MWKGVALPNVEDGKERLAQRFRDPPISKNDLPDVPVLPAFSDFRTSHLSATILHKFQYTYTDKH